RVTAAGWFNRCASSRFCRQSHYRRDGFHELMIDCDIQVASAATLRGAGRSCPGEMPNCLRKQVAKYWLEENPQSKATSVTERAALEVSIVRAASSRIIWR